MLRELNLRLFGEGGEGVASAGGEMNNGSEGSAGNIDSSAAGSLRMTTEAGEPSGESTEGTKGEGVLTREEKKAKFDEMIKGEYKEFFRENFNNAFGKRFKDMKGTEERLKSYGEDLAPLYERYKVDNPRALAEAIIGNPETYVGEAAESGKSPEEIAAFNRLKMERDRREAENRRLSEAIESQRRTEAVKRQTEAWKEEAAEVSKLHPEFNLAKELSDPDFMKGIRMGMPMLKMYRALHFDDISKSITDTAKRAAAESIKSANARPGEVGAESVRSVRGDVDVNTLTDEDMDAIIERVRRGERISFTP